MVKFAVGSVGDSLSASSIKSYLAEFIATLLFVFAGVGSAIAYGKLTTDAALDPAGLVAIAIAHALALFVGVSIAANISGGHLNPAVTFGLAIGGNITVITALFYWIAQCVGSIVACFLLQFVTGGLEFEYTFIDIVQSAPHLYMAAGPFSGGSMNPARSFGPAVVSGDFSQIWIYWVGPLIGGGLAGFIFGDVFIGSYETLPTSEDYA
ncbi:hypothetical protein E3N88_08145 [Mikania micrantha]|uniref:Aquaporin n=1 Tax=Mikania micrantha TaxID=192012 RepID=A0A5N6PFD2_9ASTR|nr:hypothetical protein E3N88_08145 [Mikania micrantha]